MAGNFYSAATGEMVSDVDLSELLSQNQVDGRSINEVYFQCPAPLINDSVYAQLGVAHYEEVHTTEHYPALACTTSDSSDWLDNDSDDDISGSSSGIEKDCESNLPVHLEGEQSPSTDDSLQDSDDRMSGHEMYNDPYDADESDKEESL